ncbi:Cell division control protein 11 [Hanseniaspora osmophila]|uniref:Cell division control protein 11 n=1 Tax=Hanseniaspora osmophila TaxID=56408 RepID=A0A1E5REX5_9ASCO|nr:Cell division control protein 11 [Hanseniaspora osmophila]
MNGIIEASANLRKRKQLKRGINFTIMVIGPSGSGRSTFINTLCGQNVVECSGASLKQNSKYLSAGNEIQAQVPVDLRHEMVELEDDEGVKIQLNIIDTPGFGSSIDNTNNFDIISDYIKHQYDEILLEESRVKRNPRFKDGRVHVLLYFIEPTGHGLKEFDILFMQKIGDLCNILPVISKSDSLTVEELKLNKKMIIDDINYYNLPIFNFLDNVNEDEISEEDYETNLYLKSLLPFSVIGSNELYTGANGEQIRARKYPWGIIDVEDANVSDFVVLRNTLLISHLNDLKEHTHQILYENYRTETLSGNSHTKSNNNNSNNYYSGSRSVDAHNTATVASTSVSSSNAATDTQGDKPHEYSNESETNHVAAAGDNYLAKEEQIKLEEERLKAFEERVQQELQLKRQELLKREQELREIEERLEREASMNNE